MRMVMVVMVMIVMIMITAAVVSRYGSRGVATAVVNGSCGGVATAVVNRSCRCVAAAVVNRSYIVVAATVIGGSGVVATTVITVHPVVLHIALTGSIVHLITSVIIHNVLLSMKLHRKVRLHVYSMNNYGIGAYNWGRKIGGSYCDRNTACLPRQVRCEIK